MNAVNIIERDGDLLVSSVSLAAGSGVEHRAVLQLIGNNIADFEDFGTVAFEMRPLPQGGNPLRVALLNEQQATLLMTFQRNTPQVREFKKVLVHTFFEMGRQLAAMAVPQTLPEALRAYAAEVEQREALEARVTELEPVAAHAETFRQADGLRTVGDVANDFKAHCAANFPKVKVRHRDVWDHAGRLGIVIRTDSVRHNQPTAQAIEAGWARPHRSTFDTNTRGEQTAVSTRLTPRGEARLWDGLAAWLGAHGTLDGARFRRSEAS